MASKAVRLPSGNYRSQATYKDADGKRHYKSFTAPTRKEAEYAANDFEHGNDYLADESNWTLEYAIGQYIDLKKDILSPTTIQGYKMMQKRSFQSIMQVQLKDINSDVLQKAILKEMNRKTQRGKAPSPKYVKNAYGLVSAVLGKFMPDKAFRVDMPRVARQIRTLPEPAEIYRAVEGTDIELACLLALWLSFSMSEIRGLTKSNSIDGDYITIRQVMVYVNHMDVIKPLGKTDARLRRHKMPDKIKELIEQVDGDVIVPYPPSYLLRKLKRCLAAHNVTEISFHDLRHVSASIMAVLRIPDKYCMERGGWASDNIMKRVYMETFSEERENADKKVNDYFKTKLNI